MATTKSDELNIVGSEQVVEKRNVLDIDTFFNEMYLTESEKEERKDLAKTIFIVLSALLTIIKANEVLNNEHDTGYYKNYLVDSLTPVYDALFGQGKYKSLIDNFANEVVDSTMRHINEPYFTSDDRATVNSEQQSNAAYNQEQYDQAVASGKTHKRWITMHDKRVRATHDAADGQEVEIKKPFEVGNSELMFPCDLSLGANLKEIVNCRCVCIYTGDKDTKDSLKEPKNDVRIKSPLIPMNLQFFARTGKERAEEYSQFWSTARLDGAVEKFVPNYQTRVNEEKGKIIYYSEKSKYEVIYDYNGNYFRIRNTELRGSHSYVDINGNSANNIYENGRWRGRTKAEFEAATHFNAILD